MLKSLPAAAAAICALAVAAVSPADVVTDFNGLLLSSIAETSQSPPMASRELAMVSTAMHNAVNNAGNHGGPTTALPYDRGLAAAQAARDTLVAMYPARAAQFDARLQLEVNRVSDPALRATSIAFGSQVATHIAALRTGDGSSAASPWTQGSGPGAYQPTAPGQTSARFNQFATVTPWNLASPSQFRPGPPPALDSQQYAEELNQVRQLGALTGSTRTDYQTQTAQFWAAGGGTVTPPGMWNLIAANIGTGRGNTLEQNAQMFAALNQALADAAIACWDSKFAYDRWRPVTAIRQADTDGNDLTISDPTWTPLLATPPFQAYASGHSTFSAAAAVVLGGLYGDATSFSVFSQGTGTTRSYTSLWAAAEEAGMSRVFGGIHFMSDNLSALTLGTRVGGATLAAFSIPAPGCVTVLAVAGLGAARRRRR